MEGIITLLIEHLLVPFLAFLQQYIYVPAVLAPNGSIYCVPRNAARVLKIPHGAHGNQWWALSPFVNRS